MIWVWEEMALLREDIRDVELMDSLVESIEDSMICKTLEVIVGDMGYEDTHFSRSWSTWTSSCGAIAFDVWRW